MKKKYEVLREMPWMEKGFEFEADQENRYVYLDFIDEFFVRHKPCFDKNEIKDLIKKGWIKPVNERIELSWNGYTEQDKVVFTVKGLTPYQLVEIQKACDLAEAAINGELFTKEDMIMFISFKYGKIVNPEFVEKQFNDWLKDR